MIPYHSDQQHPRTNSKEPNLITADMSLTQLRNLLPLPDEELQQVLDYAATLSKQGAADHFNGILGESPQSIEFISSFNSRRKGPVSSSSSSPQPPPQEDLSAGVPKLTRGPKKKKAPLHTPAPRQIQDTYASQGTAYIKNNEDDYITKRPHPPPPPTMPSHSMPNQKPSKPPPQKHHLPQQVP